jgi:hypothetical protein
LREYQIQEKELIQFLEQEVLQMKKLSRTGEVYQRQTIYDEFGRKIGSNEFSVHGRPRDHTNPHHHTNDKNESHLDIVHLSQVYIHKTP